jgi:hypothetical protein
MDGIHSRSRLEEQRHHRRGNDRPSRRDASIDADVPGIDALHFSSSSPNTAPATASLMRQSGLTTRGISSGEYGNDAGGNGDSPIDEEFKFRFHWMRPHPSLAFALEDTLSTTGEYAGISNGDEVKRERGRKARGENPSQMNINPAIESARLVEAYRSSQMTKTRVADAEDYDREDPTSQGMDRSSKDTDRGTARFPLELPKLRINLASLIEPPLMTSWLPGEDYGISREEGDASE